MIWLGSFRRRPTSPMLVGGLLRPDLSGCQSRSPGRWSGAICRGQPYPLPV